MKELTIEEKAVRYDKALETARKIHSGEDVAAPPNWTTCEVIFPELRESEDERIRKGLIALLKFGLEDGSSIAPGFNTTKEQAIAWLEKQGEQIDFANREYWRGYWEGKQEILDKYADLEKQGKQKPADKVQPKFCKGDWIIFNGLVLYVKEVVKGFYRTISIGGITNSYDWDIDKIARLWTIQDAKDGDVLCTYECCEPKIVFILKGTPKKHYALSYYCYYNIMYPHFASDSEKGCLAPNDEDVKPATKEQRDQLEKAMADVGYTFDFEEKKLKELKKHR